MYAGLSFKKQFLLQITDASLKMFGDTRIKAACNRTGCVFAVRNRILTRKVRGIQAMRFCIFEIQGPNEVEVEKCNRIIENYFPDYKLRRPYSEKDVSVRLKVGQWTPDNTSLYFLSQRYGLGKSHMGDLQRMGPEEGDGAVRQGNSVVDALARSLRQDWPASADAAGFGGLGGGRRRAISQGPQPRRRIGGGAVNVEEETAAAGGRYVGFREREAMLKSEIDRLESYLSNLQLA